MNKILLLIAFTFLAFNVSCKKNTTSSQNSDDTEYMASFIVNPTSGTTTTTFTFDASGSGANIDDIPLENVRWDWNNDGTYDTIYRVTMTADHKFTTTGTITVKLEAKYSGGLTSTATKSVTITQPILTEPDIDGNVYQTVKIGEQWWMAENLRVTHYRNGDEIQNVTDETQWDNLATGAYCSPERRDSNVPAYGRSYNWYAVDDSRGLAPNGWHIPSDEEWKKLEMYLGLSQSEADTSGLRGTVEGGKLKETGTSHWLEPNNGATNSSGFSALPGGMEIIDTAGSEGNFWSSTESDRGVWYRLLWFYNSGIYRVKAGKVNGFSVRCVKD